MISISKIKNISLIKKNWILNGIRVFEIGSNPHSNEEFFSRFFKVFFDKIILKINMMKGINNKIINIKIKLIMVSILKLINFINWKLIVMYIYYKDIKLMHH